MNTKTLEIPQHADRCVVLFAHPAYSGELTEDDRTTAKQTKNGNTELIAALAGRFGTPTVHCGQSNVSIMTAVTTGHTKITPLHLLDTPRSHRQARKRARKVLFETSVNKNLVIAYSDHGIVNKAIGASNATSKRGIQPIAETAVVFIDKNGRVIGLHRQDLLTLAAA